MFRLESMLGIGLIFFDVGWRLLMDRFWLRPMLDGFLVGAAEILGDPPAVMASALEK